MMAMKRKPGRMEKLKHVVKREGRALFAAGSVFVGVSTLLLIVESSWQAMPADWWRLALVVTFMALPEVFVKLQEADEPYLILFALAFREGFLYLPFFGPDLAGWVTKVRGLWKSLKRK